MRTARWSAPFGYHRDLLFAVATPVVVVISLVQGIIGAFLPLGAAPASMLAGAVLVVPPMVAVLRFTERRRCR